MPRPKCLMMRLMPYPTMLNRARMLRALGWDVSLIHEQNFANSQLLVRSAKVFTDIWPMQTLLSDTASMHDFIRSKGFDLLYTIGPPDRLNVNFLNAPCPWIHDERDLFLLTTPRADDPEKLKEAQAQFKEESDMGVACVNGCDVAVFVTPWQRRKFNRLIYPTGTPKESVWLPNVPWFLPEIPEKTDKDPDTIYWGYTGNMKAAWQNTPDWVGEVAGELDKKKLSYEFHHWSMMEMHESQPVDWFFSRQTREQHEMIAEMGASIDYGILAPPTKSDGQNGPTGWPGKIGDYVAAGLTCFVPDNFMIASTVRRNGWGFAYNSPRDVARIMSTRRKPKSERQPALCLSQRPFMNVLRLAILRAQSNFKERYAKPVQVAVSEPVSSLVVASDGNRFHAETHVAPILGGQYMPIVNRGPNEIWPSADGYENLYMLGFWAADKATVEEYAAFMYGFKRIVLQWAGTDILLMREHPAKESLDALFSDRRIAHFAQHKGMASEVSKLMNVACEVVATPSSLVYEKPFKMPSPFAVSAYYPNVGGTRELYRLDLVDDVVRKMPDVLFYLHAPAHAAGENPGLPENAVWLGDVGRDPYPQFLKTVSILLRLTRHDGVPMSMVEHMCAGRRCVMTQDFPFGHLVEPDVDDVVKMIRSLQKERRPDMAASDYWRMWNDPDRFRNRVRALLDSCEVQDAENVTPEVA